MLFQLHFQMCEKDIKHFWIDEEKYIIIVMWSDVKVFLYNDMKRLLRERISSIAKLP